MSQLELIKKLREATGAGVVDVKKALDEAGGDEARAKGILRERGQAKALKRAEREVHEGVVASYVHSNRRVGAIVKLYCETDFVARNDEFKALAADIAMHVTAMNPTILKPEDMPEEVLESERKIWRKQLEGEGKKVEFFEKILAGKEKKFCEENALLTQAFVKDSNKTVAGLIAESVHKIGENIQVGSFVRFEI